MTLIDISNIVLLSGIVGAILLFLGYRKWRVAVERSNALYPEAMKYALLIDQLDRGFYDWYLAHLVKGKTLRSDLSIYLWQRKLRAKILSMGRKT